MQQVRRILQWKRGQDTAAESAESLLPLEADGIPGELGVNVESA